MSVGKIGIGVGIAHRRGRAIAPIITGTGPALGALTHGARLGDAVTAGSYSSTAGDPPGSAVVSATMTMSINGAAAQAYDADRIVSADDVYVIQEDVTDDAGSPARLFSSASVTVSPTVPAAFTAGMWALSNPGTGGVLDVTINSLPDNGGRIISGIQYSVDGAPWVESGGITDFTITGLTDGVSVGIRIRARNGVGTSVTSDTKIETPSAPMTVSNDGTGITVAQAPDGGLSFTITDPNRGWVEQVVSASAADADEGTSLTTTMLDTGPIILDEPVLAGDADPDVGETLTIVPPLWAGETAAQAGFSIAYATNGANTVDVTDPDNPTLLVDAADAGVTLTVTATVTDSNGNRVATSNGIAIPAAASGIQLVETTTNPGVYTEFAGVAATTSQASLSFYMERASSAATHVWIDAGPFMIRTLDTGTTQVHVYQSDGTQLAAWNYTAVAFDPTLGPNHILVRYDDTQSQRDGVGFKFQFYVNGTHVAPTSIGGSDPGVATNSRNLRFGVGDDWTIAASGRNRFEQAAQVTGSDPAAASKLGSVLLSPTIVSPTAVYNAGVVEDLSAFDATAPIVIDSRVTLANWNAGVNHGTAGAGTVTGTYADAGTLTGV